jgi:general secretion pathway protein A
MYEDFFGLSRSPFQLSPDPFFLISSERNQEALASISEAIRLRKGFVALTGEVGTGKTLVLRCLVELWEREEIPFAYFIGPRLSTVDFLSYITFELGINVTDPTKGNLLRALYGFLLAQFEKGLTTVLIIDEAHQLPRNVLEEIRLLTNFETAQQKLVQIVLVGQPELDKKLDSVELRSLKQRIAVRCRLEPLCEEEIRHYIERRLELAGADAKETAIFPDETVKAIYRHSQGIPRLVNSICDQALMAACARQIRVVPVEVIREVASHFRLDSSGTLKQPEKPLSLASHVERSVPNKSWAVVPTVDVPGVKLGDADLTLGRPDDSNVKPAETAPPSKPETSHESGFREHSTEHSALAFESFSPARAATQLTTFPGTRGQTVASSAGLRTIIQPRRILRDSWSSQIRRWLRPGLRLSLIIGIVAVVPVALATGIFMAHRQKGTATVPHPVASMREAFSEGQTAATVQPVGISSAIQVHVGSPDAIVPRADIGTSKPAAELERLAPRTKAIPSTLSRPVFRSSHLLTSTEPPLNTGMQTKESDVGRGLFDTSVPGPTPPQTDLGISLQPPKLVSSPRPTYPSLARTGNVQGVVMIDAVVNETGKVTDMKMISGNPVLKQAAMDALRTWKYEPARLNGQPTAAHVQVRINFSLH